MLPRADGTMSPLCGARFAGIVAVSSAVFAASTASASESLSASTGGPSSPRREVALGLGYGAIVARRPIRNDADGRGPQYDSTFTGWMLEVTSRRVPTFEYGLLAWSTGGSSDGHGSYAHLLLQFEAEARWLPWGLGRIEPWFGWRIGMVAADDYAKWDATPSERAHSVSRGRPGLAGGLDAGLRGRVGELVAIGLRGGLLYLRLPVVNAPVSEAGDTKPAYVVRPTDYGRQIWFSVTVSAELTIPD